MKNLSQVALQIQHDFNVDAGRITRAAEIYQAGGVRKVSENRYAVCSQSKKAEYLVNSDTVDCGCWDAASNNICKHILSVMIFRAMELTWQERVDAEFSKTLAGLGITAQGIAEA